MSPGRGSRTRCRRRRGHSDGGNDEAAPPSRGGDQRVPSFFPTFSACRRCGAEIVSHLARPLSRLQAIWESAPSCASNLSQIYHDVAHVRHTEAPRNARAVLAATHSPCLAAMQDCASVMQRPRFAVTLRSERLQVQVLPGLLNSNPAERSTWLVLARERTSYGGFAAQSRAWRARVGARPKRENARGNASRHGRR